MRQTKRVRAMPATRKRARALGLDLTQIAGTGPGGRVTPADLDKLAQQDADETIIPLRGLRRRIAEKMIRSAQTAAHVTHIDRVDVTELVLLRKRLLRIAQSKGIKLTYLPFVIRAVVTALMKYPIFNATLDDVRNAIVIKKPCHMGIATATDEGLIVPVIKSAQQKSIIELATEIETLSIGVREKKVAVEELQGGTFTITNVGSIGGLASTPIINYPEVAILGVHRIREEALVVNGQIAVRDVTYLALSFDHRVADGALGAAFINEIIARLESPNQLLMA